MAQGRAAWDRALGAFAVEGGCKETQRINVNNHYRIVVDPGGTLRLFTGPEPSSWGHEPSTWPASQTPGSAAPRPLTDVTQAATAAVDAASDAPVKLTDDDSSTVWRAASSQATLTFALPEATTPQQHTPTCGGKADAAHPSLWRLEESQDGTTWQVLDSRDEEAFACAFLLRSFVVAHPQASQFLRLVVASVSPAVQLENAELELLAVRSA